MQYLSPAWLEAADRALGDDPSLQDATADVALTLEQVVTGAPAGVAGPDGTVTWHLRVDHGKVGLAAGPAPAADLRFTTTYATAAAVATGQLGAQRAFADGRLRVGGDIGVLGRYHRTFAAVNDALDAVRGATTFPGVTPRRDGDPSPGGPAR